MKRLTSFLLFLATVTALSAQEEPVVDTLSPSIKVAERSAVAHGGRYMVAGDAIESVSSPTGEADVMKFVQTLPGIATGIEGSSAIYARGGNIGSNLISLDGIPLYSSSHLMGFASSLPETVVGGTEFFVGGFPSEDGNLTASHIRMKSADGSFEKVSGGASVSNFLVSADVSAPVVSDRLSLLASARVSPAGLEYGMVKGLLNSRQSLFTDLSAVVYDIFVKGKYRFTPHRTLSLWVFNTADSYRFAVGDNATDAIGWRNTVVNLQYDDILSDDFVWRAGLSYNNNVSHQSQERILEGVDNTLSLSGAVNEVTLLSQAELKFSETGTFSFGAKARLGVLNPVRLSAGSNVSVLSTLNAQVEWQKDWRYDVRMAVRLNAYFCRLGIDNQKMFDPEASLLVRYWFSPHFGVEMTGDYVTQYYHVLEGIPLGWSLDLTVPSDKSLLPEQSLQAYGGLFYDFGRHHLGAGAYYKKMKNIVFYTEAKALFSSSVEGWHENVESGGGTSYGAEFIYEKTGDILTYRAAYTWSKTDRLFAGINRGRPFPAKYDRRHVANASAGVRIFRNASLALRFNTTFTYQSGHWETVRNGYQPFWTFDGSTPGLAPFVTEVNGYRMKDYIRWDNSLCLSAGSGRVSHSVTIGVYNTLNRHNPFMLRFNESTRKWETVSLIPIMPNFCYSIKF